MTEDVCSSHHRGQDTSVEAHDSIVSNKQAIKDKIRDHIKAIGAATCERCEKELALSHQTASARISEMVREGTLAISKILIGRTSAGRRCRVYEVAS